MSIRQIPPLIWIIAIVSTGFSALVALDAAPLLRGDYTDWRWARVVPEAAQAAPLALIVAAYLGGLVALRRARRAWVLPAWAMIGSALITLGAVSVGEDDVLFALLANTLSGTATGSHRAAMEIAPDVGAAMRAWPALMESYWGRLIHVSLMPPGTPLLFLAASRVLAATPGLARALSMALRPYQCHNLAMMAYTDPQMASAWIGVLMPAWAALTVWPLYGLGRRLGGPEVGARAAAWWPLVPGIALFTPTWNTFLPFFSATVFWLMTPGESRRPARVVLAGLVMGVGSFLAFALAPALALLGLYVLLDDLLVRRVSWRAPVATGLWFGLGLLLPWVPYWLLSGVTPLDILATIMKLHLGYDRPYWPWVWLHLYDFALFSGLPFILLALWRAASEARRRQVGVLGVAFVVTVLALDLAHLGRGETGRIWLFFAPVILALAALAPPFDNPQRRREHREAIINSAPSVSLEFQSLSRENGAQAAITAAGAAGLLLLAGFLRPMAGVDLTLPPAYPPPGDLPASARPVEATFGDVMTLRAYAGAVRGDHVELTLRWEGRARTGVHYWFSALLVGPDGRAGGKLNWPSGLYDLPPTTCWTPGQPVQYQVQIPLEGLPPEDVWVSLSVFDYDTGKRLPVTAPGALVDDQIGLGPIGG